MPAAHSRDQAASTSPIDDGPSARAGDQHRAVVAPARVVVPVRGDDRARAARFARLADVLPAERDVLVPLHIDRIDEASRSRRTARAARRNRSGTATVTIRIPAARRAATGPCVEVANSILIPPSHCSQPSCSGAESTASGDHLPTQSRRRGRSAPQRRQGTSCRSRSQGQVFPGKSGTLAPQGRPIESGRPPGRMQWPPRLQLGLPSIRNASAAQQQSCGRAGRRTRHAFQTSSQHALARKGAHLGDHVVGRRPLPKIEIDRRERQARASA